jgi:hypothetical protein
LAIGTSIYWSINAAINEINLNYGTGRETAEFIKNNNLDRLHILAAWRQNVDSDTGEKYSDYNYLEGVATLTYFDKNIFYNFNKQDNRKCYLLHKINTDGAHVKQLIENTYPDILLWSGSNNFTFDSTIRLDDYALVRSVHGNFIWKNKVIENRQLIFLRKDLLKNYSSIKEIDLVKELINEE